MAFLHNSRYFDQPTLEATDARGRKVTAIKLRRPPATEGEPHQVDEKDRLDLLANDRYEDPTLFWHIADANSELEANTLVAEPGRTITIPRSK